MRGESMAENKSRNVLEKLSVEEEEKEYLSRWPAEAKEGTEKAHAEAQVARAEVDAARAKASLALKHATDAESELKSLHSYTKKMEASTRAGVERAHAIRGCVPRARRVDHPFWQIWGGVGLRFLWWLQEELELVPSIVTGLMSYASLVTYEGAANALSREGCRHFKVFDQANEDFDRRIFQVEDDVLKQSARALYDRMWGRHSRDTVRERADRTLAYVF
jgi:hypothetical protein